MVGQVLTLGALVALAQAKAIVTNRCESTVYLWSVPEKSGVADNLPLAPGKRYEEPWRYGDSVTPGVAIKISPEENGINEGKSEVNLQYAVDPSDSGKIWIDLFQVQSPLPQGSTLYTCSGQYTSEYVSTHQVELVLCGAERSTVARDNMPQDIINDCTYLHSQCLYLNLRPGPR
jgi:hypothetical protein